MIEPNFLKKNNKIVIDNFEREFTIENANDYLDALIHTYNTHRLDIILDFKNINYIDSKGIGILTQFIRHVKENGNNVSVYNVQGFVLKLFDLSRLDKVIDYSKEDIPENFKKNDIDRSKIYIISDHLTENEKISIKKCLPKEFVFKAFDEVNFENHISVTEKKCDMSLDDIYKITDSHKIIEKCGRCLEEHECELFENIISFHPDAAVRKSLIIWSVNIKNEKIILKILKKAFINENNKDIKELLLNTINKIRNI